MKTMIENLINGNLTDAKRQAKGKTMTRIAQFCQQELGWSFSRAVRAAHYLKTGQHFQEYCDAA